MEINNSLIKEPLLENVSLRDIIKSINLGLLQYSEEKNLRIINPNKKGYVIIVAELTIVENILDFLKNESSYPSLDYKVDNFRKLESELTMFDYIVLTLENSKETKTQRIINIPLFELLTASENLIADDSGKHNLDDISISWNLDSTGWYCYDIHK